MITRYLPAALAASTLLVLTLAAGPTFAAPAQADDDAARKAVVSIADLDLNSAAGRAILAARIHRAAEAVCGPEPDLRDMGQFLPYRRCMKQTVDTALAAIPAASQVAGKVKPAG